MKFTKLLSVVALVCSGVCCVNASNSIEISFMKDGNNGMSYNVTYRDDMRSSSDTSRDISDLAGSINNLSKGALSVGSTERECFNGEFVSYSVGLNNGDFKDLVVLNNTKCNGALGRIVFSGDKKDSTSVQINFDSASDMKLPVVECKNIGLLKFKMENDSETDVGYMAGLTVDSTTGLCYNKSVKINGGKYNNSNNNLDTLCLIANRGTNQLKAPNGTKYKFGIRYDIPGITDVLAQKGLTITDITATPNAPANAQKVILLDDINGLLNSGAGTVAIDGDMKKNKLFRPVKRFTATKIGQLVNKKLDKSVETAFLKPENNFLNISIS